MATGDITFFNAALLTAFCGGWATSDDIKCAICDNTTTPTAATATPALGDFTQVGTGGSYVAGGTSLSTWNGNGSVGGSTLTWDSTTNPTWAQNASNDTDAHWGILYNDTQAGDDAFAFIELGGPVDMSTGSLTITWNASGIFTIVA
jgi:hypothetical protein